MSKSDPLIIQAVREAAQSFEDMLQVIVLEGHLLAQDHRLNPETAERAANIVRTAREAANLSRSLFGQGEAKQEPGD